MVEVILEDKQQLQADTHQAPLVVELKKDTPLLKTSAYHHPHHLEIKKPTRWQKIIQKDNNPTHTHHSSQ